MRDVLATRGRERVREQKARFIESVGDPFAVWSKERERGFSRRRRDPVMEGSSKREREREREICTV